jgi:hypothetical protein
MPTTHGNAATATEAVVAYFKSASVTVPIGFSIESAEEQPAGSGHWRIVCALWEYIGANTRSRYTVLVDPGGRVEKVTRIGPE